MSSGGRKEENIKRKGGTKYGSKKERKIDEKKRNKNTRKW
jgi:hypothetical protein